MKTQGLPSVDQKVRYKKRNGEVITGRVTSVNDRFCNVYFWMETDKGPFRAVIKDHIAPVRMVI